MAATWDSTVKIAFPVEREDVYGEDMTAFESGAVQRRTRFAQERHYYQLTATCNATERAAFWTFYHARMEDNDSFSQPDGCEMGNYYFVGRPHERRVSPNTYEVTFALIEAL